ncbi:hypothetical protein SK128_003664, partial [Halocaridina rubra]
PFKPRISAQPQCRVGSPSHSREHKKPDATYVQPSGEQGCQPNTEVNFILQLAKNIEFYCYPCVLYCTDWLKT